jgi:hypothetical protein
MLAIDYRLEGSVVCVRKSMDKFSSRSLDVEVSRAFDRPGESVYLSSKDVDLNHNRPMLSQQAAYYASRYWKRNSYRGLS